MLVPAGLWLTRPYRLKSNVNLHLATGATLLFTRDFDQYPLVQEQLGSEPAANEKSIADFGHRSYEHCYHRQRDH